MNKLLYPILALIAAGGIGFFYLKPAWENIQALQDQKAQFESALSDAKEIANTLDRLKTERNNISHDDLLRLETFLPTQIDTTHTIQNLHGIVARYGVTLSTITVTSEKAGSKDASHLGKVDFRLGFSATYQQFKSILADVEKSLQLADVKELRITQPRTSDSTTATQAQSGGKTPPPSQNLSQFNIDLTLYTYKD